MLVDGIGDFVQERRRVQEMGRPNEDLLGRELLLVQLLDVSGRKRVKQMLLKTKSNMLEQSRDLFPKCQGYLK